MEEINPTKAFFIKLGSGGRWEQDCVQKHQTIRLGFDDTDHSSCMKGDWEKIKRDLLQKGKAKGKATEIAHEIRHFYESDESTLWVTFFGGHMWWAFAKPGVKRLEDGSKIRAVCEKWHSTDIQKKPLTLDKISGRFLKVLQFQGTICSVDLEYVKNKINGRVSPDVSEAQDALAILEQRVIPLIQSLTWKDFELLVDLIFTDAGWQRISVLGKTQKTLDLDLKAPVTGERAMVQVKSASNRSEYIRYHNEFTQSPQFTRLFFVVHSPEHDLQHVQALSNSTVLTATELAPMVVSAGLTGWLLDKNT